MITKQEFTTVELQQIEVGVGLVKKIVRGFTRGYDYIDKGALEGELNVWLMYMVKKYDPELNDSFESYITICIKKKMRDIQKKSKYLNYTVKHCVTDNVVNDEGEAYSLIDETVSVQDVADAYIEKLDKQAFDEATEKAMSDIYSGATTEQLKIVKLYLSGMTITEIAKVLNFNHHMKVSRELKKLKKVIKMNPFATKVSV
mgnify:CR=1 FL=1